MSSTAFARLKLAAVSLANMAGRSARAVRGPLRPDETRGFGFQARLNGAVAAALLALPCLLGCQTTGERSSPTAPATHERHETLEGQPNFRDMGGYTTADGRSVKWGLLYRSGALHKLTDLDVKKLQARRLAKIIDFRADSEIAKAQDRIPAGATTLRLPVGSRTNLEALTMAIKTGEVSGLGEGFLCDANREFVRDFSSAYAELLKQITDSANRPMVWHCTLGKDRAGLGAAIVLLVLGVPKEAVMEDYLLSNTYRAQQMQRELADFTKKRSAAQDGSRAKRDTEVFQALIEARREYLEAAFDEMMQRYGSIEAYIRRGLGITNAQRKRLRRQLLE